jgi:hypothetical protein
MSDLKQNPAVHGGSIKLNENQLGALIQLGNAPIESWATPSLKALVNRGLASVSRTPGISFPVWKITTRGQESLSATVAGRQRCAVTPGLPI